MRPSPSASTDGVSASLSRLDRMLEAEFQRIERCGLLQEHPARGLFLDPGYVRTLLAGGPAAAPAQRAGRETSATMGALRRIFSLSPLEADIVLLAVAPEIDVRYESIYAYLHNDVTRRKASIDLAIRLFLDGDFARPEARRCFHPSATLLRERLVTLAGETFPSRTISADVRLAAFLAGDDSSDASFLDGRLAAVASWLPVGKPMPLPFEGAHVTAWRSAVRQLAPTGGLLLMRGRPGSGKRTIATEICRHARLPLIAARIPSAPAREQDATSSDAPTESPMQWASPGVRDTLGLLRREARLRGAAVYLSLPSGASIETVSEAFDGSGVVVICGRKGRHDDDRIAGYSFDIPVLPAKVQRALWQNELGDKGAPAGGLDEVASKFSLTAGQIAAAAREASRQSKLRGAAGPSDDDLHRAARHQAGSGLLRLATRVELSYGWEDLVLPPRVVHQLSDICAQVRHREKVYRDWGFATRIGPARGIAVLFAGPSGTGKTMSAGVIARELGLELYRIDLATIVSKYIGETEKNLSRIFEEAEDSNAILLFDEADALFGKRSEVKDAHDRYANLEVAYLLQRMETYSGIAILATNLAGNLDDAFARRMAHLVEFVSPDALLREKLWRKSLPSLAPVEKSVNFAALAHQFSVSGGNIRNIAVAAAFLASEQGASIGMDHLIRATARELGKIGRQPSRAEFNEFYPLVEHRQ